jgi:hypothetical protein
MRALASFLLLLASLLPISCTPPQPPLQTAFYIYRFEPPALLEFSSEFQLTREIPFSTPPDCGLFNMFPAPLGKYMAIEWSCPNGQTVLLLDADTASVVQPIRDSDSHFLAWQMDGKAVYLKIDSLGSPGVIRASTDGPQKSIPVTEFTYDLTAGVDPEEFTFTFSRGLGQGSELWLAKRGGKIVELIYADPLHYLSFARYSPDGSQIAFLKIPDTSTPFTVGELWVMQADGSHAHELADADGGHGYAANWSPDGKRIAFVMRENPDDERADQSSEALISNVYIVDVGSESLAQITHLEKGWVETPVWSPDGNTLGFNVVINDRMEVRLADLSTGEIRSLVPESSCCPAWLRK